MTNLHVSVVHIKPVLAILSWVADHLTSRYYKNSLNGTTYPLILAKFRHLKVVCFSDCRILDYLEPDFVACMVSQTAQCNTKTVIYPNSNF